MQELHPDAKMYLNLIFLTPQNLNLFAPYDLIQLNMYLKTPTFYINNFLIHSIDQ